MKEVSKNPEVFLLPRWGQAVWYEEKEWRVDDLQFPVGKPEEGMIVVVRGKHFMQAGQKPDRREIPYSEFLELIKQGSR